MKKERKLQIRQVNIFQSADGKMVHSVECQVCECVRCEGACVSVSSVVMIEEQ